MERFDENYYELLGIAEDASHETIMRAWRDKAVEVRRKLAEPTGGGKASNLSMAINQAKMCLLDPKRRALHDNWIIGRRLDESKARARNGSAAPPSPEREQESSTWHDAETFAAEEATSPPTIRVSSVIVDFGVVTPGGRAPQRTIRIDCTGRMTGIRVERLSGTFWYLLVPEVKSGGLWAELIFNCSVPAAAHSGAVEETATVIVTNAGGSARQDISVRAKVEVPSSTSTTRDEPAKTAARAGADRSGREWSPGFSMALLAAVGIVLAISIGPRLAPGALIRDFFHFLVHDSSSSSKQLSSTTPRAVAAPAATTIPPSRLLEATPATVSTHATRTAVGRFPKFESLAYRLKAAPKLSSVPVTSYATDGIWNIQCNTGDNVAPVSVNRINVSTIIANWSKTSNAVVAYFGDASQASAYFNSVRSTMSAVEAGNVCMTGNAGGIEYQFGKVTQSETSTDVYAFAAPVAIVGPPARPSQTYHVDIRLRSNIVVATFGHNDGSGLLDAIDRALHWP